MKREVVTLPSVLSILVLLAGVGCGQADVQSVAAGGETERKEASVAGGAMEAETTSAKESGAEARAGNGSAVAKSREAEARAGDGTARAGDAVAGEDGADGVEGRVEGDGIPSKVVLKVGGEPGTRFSGACVVGGEEREVSGRVPERFVYEPDGRKVECELRARGPAAGPLEVSVIAGGGDQRQEIEVIGDALSFEYSGDGVSYTATSDSGSVSQETRITGSSGSSVSSSSVSNSSVSSYSSSR